MTSRDRTVIQDHVRARRASKEKRTSGVAAIRFHESAERKLETSVEQTLGHLVLCGNQLGNIWWLQRRLEQLDVATILQLEIRFERALANRASSIYRR